MILLGVLVAMVFIILLGSPRNMVKTGGRFFIKNYRKFFWGIFSILVIYQITVLLIVKVKLQFDVLGLLNGLHDKKAVGIYLSNNPNNRLLFYIFY